MSIRQVLSTNQFTNFVLFKTIPAASVAVARANTAAAARAPNAAVIAEALDASMRLFLVCLPRLVHALKAVATEVPIHHARMLKEVAAGQTTQSMPGFIDHDIAPPVLVFLSLVDDVLNPACLRFGRRTFLISEHVTRALFASSSTSSSSSSTAHAAADEWRRFVESVAALWRQHETVATERFGQTVVAQFKQSMAQFGPSAPSRWSALPECLRFNLDAGLASLLAPPTPSIDNTRALAETKTAKAPAAGEAADAAAGGADADAPPAVDPRLVFLSPSQVTLVEETREVVRRELELLETSHGRARTRHQTLCDPLRVSGASAAVVTRNRFDRSVAAQLTFTTSLHLMDYYFRVGNHEAGIRWAQALDREVADIALAPPPSVDSTASSRMEPGAFAALAPLKLPAHLVAVLAYHTLHRPDILSTIAPVIRSGEGILRAHRAQPEAQLKAALEAFTRATEEAAAGASAGGVGNTVLGAEISDGIALQKNFNAVHSPLFDMALRTAVVVAAFVVPLNEATRSDSIDARERRSLLRSSVGCFSLLRPTALVAADFSFAAAYLVPARTLLRMAVILGLSALGRDQLSAELVGHPETSLQLRLEGEARAEVGAEAAAEAVLKHYMGAQYGAAMRGLFGEGLTDVLARQPQGAQALPDLSGPVEAYGSLLGHWAHLQPLVGSIATALGQDVRQAVIRRYIQPYAVLSIATMAERTGLATGPTAAAALQDELEQMIARDALGTAVRIDAAKGTLVRSHALGAAAGSAEDGSLDVAARQLLRGLLAADARGGSGVGVLLGATLRKALRKSSLIACEYAKEPLKL